MRRAHSSQSGAVVRRISAIASWALEPMVVLDVPIVVLDAGTAGSVVA
jgi:hypothetical protein